jgi:NAD(P)-dependent dehydrogenase (short-subunit alcohol dehydrogenase family)
MSEHQPVSLVTGAGSGIGRACAIALSGEGHRVVLMGRRREPLEETAEACAEETLILPGDVAQAEQATAAVEGALEAFGRIDAIVHCAGLAPMKSIEQLSIEEWQAVLATNLSAAFYLAKAGWPAMVKQQAGVIVNISSMASRDPFPGFAAYGAAKAGVNLLGLALAREGQPHNIRVHTIAPGAVETPMFRGLFTAEQYASENTLSPEDIARAVVQCIAGDLVPTSGEVIYLHKRL